MRACDASSVSGRVADAIANGAASRKSPRPLKFPRHHTTRPQLRARATAGRRGQAAGCRLPGAGSLNSSSGLRATQ